MLALPRTDFIGEPGAVMSCPPGSEGAGRKRTSVMMQRAALRPYLNGLDHFVKRQLRCQGYVRYVDDVLLFADDKATLHAWRASLIQFLAGLRFTLHEQRAQPRPSSTGVPFLGFQVFPDHRRLKRRSAVNARRRLKALASAYQRGEVELPRVHAGVQGWTNHARYGDTWGLRKAVLGDIVLRRPYATVADLQQDL